MSQTSPRGLITALVGMALITVAHKVSKIIQKNNRTAVKEEIVYQAKHEDIPKMLVKKYASPEFKVKTGKDFVPWTERVLADHDQAVNRLNNVINSMVSQGMRAEDIANHFYPGNAESMRADNVPKIIRDAIVKDKRTARTEAAAREDAIVEQVFKATDVKYFDWVTEPGACKKCSAIALGGPYKVGDPDSPRIPESSHPNCRCRRIKAEVPKPYEFLDLTKNDPKIIKELVRRLNKSIEDYKDLTGVDIREEIKNGTFISSKKSYDDPKAKFLEYLYHKTGYDALPKQVDNFNNVKEFKFPGGSTKVLYRGMYDTENIKAIDLLEQLKHGKMPISSSMNSTKGRGIYLSTAEFMAKMHMKKGANGVLTEWAVDKHAKVVDNKLLSNLIVKSNDLSFLYRNATYETNNEIIAIVCGYDTIEMGAVINILNRGTLLWKS